jgi:RNA 3'-terminal phosphate cyclase
MAAPGVQLNSDKHLEYFEPTVDQYVKKLEQAVASRDLSAAKQALANLDKAVTTKQRSSSQGAGVQDSQQAGTPMAAVSSALENGDFTSAEGAVSELRKSLSSAHGVQPEGTDNAGQLSSTNSGDTESSPESGQNTSGRLDLRA